MANKLNENEQIPQEDDIALLKSRPGSSKSAARLRIYVGVLIIIVILGIGSFFAIQNKQKAPDNGIINPASSTATITASQTVMPASTAAISVASGTTSTHTVTPANTTTGDATKYYIRIGVYDKTTGETKAAQLKEKGYDIKLVTVSGGTTKVAQTQYRVSISYSDKAEAKSDLTILIGKGYKNAQLISENGKSIIRINTYDSKAKAQSVQSDLNKLGYNAAMFTTTSTSSKSTERVEMRAMGYSKADGYEAMLRLKNAGYKDMKLFIQSN
jgi:hypothetical protein